MVPRREYAVMRKESWPNVDEHGISWPIDVNVGANPDSSLRILRFYSCEEAVAAGFTWVGRAG